jgi:hypothetical protein
MRFTKTQQEKTEIHKTNFNLAAFLLRSNMDLSVRFKFTTLRSV